MPSDLYHLVCPPSLLLASSKLLLTPAELKPVSVAEVYLFMMVPLLFQLNKNCYQIAWICNNKWHDTNLDI